MLVELRLGTAFQKIVELRHGYGHHLVIRYLLEPECLAWVAEYTAGFSYCLS